MYMGHTWRVHETTHVHNRHRLVCQAAGNLRRAVVLLCGCKPSTLYLAIPTTNSHAPHRKVFIGRDTRPSSPALLALVAKG